MPIARRAKIYVGNSKNLSMLARALARGELVAVPTETVYGLAGDALNAKACREIFRAKGRPTNDPLIVHIHSLADLDQLAFRNDAVEKLAKAFWPGPLTLVLPKKAVVPDLVTSGQDSVAIRCPAHPLFRKLLKLSGRPLAAPSANPFGYISPTTAAHVAESLAHKIDFVLDGGPSKVGLESTILDVRDPRHPRLLRPGAISAQDLQRVLKRPIAQHSQVASPAKTAVAVAPGMLSKHYSPRTPLALHPRLQPAKAARAPREAFLFFRRPEATLPRRQNANTFWLSAKGNFSEAARNLFSKLRELDGGKWLQLHAERAPGRSALALAINDRLSRAAAKR